MNEQIVADQKEQLRLQAGGTLNPRRHLYIERPDDEILLKLLSEGQYVNVLTSRQMGKSSLMVRTAEALIERGAKCAIVDLAAELGTPEDASTYFLGLLSKIARDLKIEVDLSTWWVERADETSNQRLMRFFREVVLEQVPGPVVCFLDEIDSTLKLPWTDDLFTALRGMHNERPMVPAYERLTFCLIGVAWPNELIKDRRTTPYNVGSTLELRDFDLARDDLTPLIHALGADAERGRRLIERALYWTGGHPYLTARLCGSLKEIGARAPEDVDRRVDDGFRSLERVSGDVHFQQVLRFLETRVANGLATFGLYEKILKGARERDQPAPAHTELKLSGLVKRDEEGCLVVRNRIYERLFDHPWIESTRPRRALQTYRRYAIAAGVALLTGAVVAGGWIAYLQMELNERQQLEARGVAITAAEDRQGTGIALPVEAPQALLEEIIPLFRAVGPLVELDLSGTRVTDLAPLAKLSELQSLDLGERFRFTDRATRPQYTEAAPVADAAPLAGLTNLQALDLSSTQVADAAPLAGLTNLQWLDLSGTQVADAAPLAGLTNLQALDLSGTQVADAAPLAGLTNLQSLYLSGTQVADAAPLAGLTNLQWLDLSGTQVADAAPLAGLTNLQWLDLSGTQVADAAPLAGLTNLQWLDLSGTQVADAAPLAGLTNLQSLDLSGTQVSPEQVTELKRALAEGGNHSVGIYGP